MPEAPVLTVDLLEELADRWRAQGAPIVPNLRPGLGDDEMDRLTEPLGLRLPAEARTWWGWHDGVFAADITWAKEREIGPDRQFYPLEEAVTRHRRHYEMLEGIDGLDPDYMWPTGRIFVTSTSNSVVSCDCTVEDGRPSPIYCQFTHDWDPDGIEQQKTASFGELVTWWIEALDQGAWSFNPGKGNWDYDWEILDPARELTGLL